MAAIFPVYIVAVEYRPAASAGQLMDRFPFRLVPVYVPPIEPAFVAAECFRFCLCCLFQPFAALFTYFLVFFAFIFDPRIIGSAAGS